MNTLKVCASVVLVALLCAGSVLGTTTYTMQNLGVMHTPVVTKLA